MINNISKVLTSMVAIFVLIVISMVSIDASDESEYCVQGNGCDYGDAPESYGPGGIYPSNFGYSLGNYPDYVETVDSESAPQYSDDATGDDSGINSTVSFAEETGWIGAQIGNMNYNPYDDTFDISFYIPTNNSSNTTGFMEHNGTLSMWFDFNRNDKFDADEAFILTHDDLVIEEVWEQEYSPYGSEDEHYVRTKLNLSFNMSEANKEILENNDSSFYTYMRFRTYSSNFTPDPSDAATNYDRVYMTEYNQYLQGETEDYKVKVNINNPVQICTSDSIASGELEYDSSEITSDGDIKYSNVLLSNGDYVDVYVKSSEYQSLHFLGFMGTGNHDSGSDFVAAGDASGNITVTDESTGDEHEKLDTQLDVYIYETGTSNPYPLALSFKLSSLSGGGQWNIEDSEYNIITTGGEIVESTSDGIITYQPKDYYYGLQSSAELGVIYSVTEPKAHYTISNDWESSHIGTVNDFTRVITILTGSYQSSINLDECSNINDYYGSTTGYTDEDDTRTNNVVDFEYDQDLSIESPNVSYYNYPDDDYLGYQITVPSKYTWEDLASNITVYSADSVSKYAYNSSSWTEVDSSHISYTFNGGVLDIHVNDTYPGFDDLVNNNNQFKFVVNGFGLVSPTALGSETTETFETRAYVQSTTEGETKEYDKDLDDVKVTDKASESFIADDLRISASDAAKLTEDSMLGRIVYEIITNDSSYTLTLDKDQLSAIIQTGKDNKDDILPLTIYSTDGQETTINVTVESEEGTDPEGPTDPTDPTDPEEVTPEVTEEDDDEDGSISETGFNYSIISLVVLTITTSVIVFVKKKFNA